MAGGDAGEPGAAFALAALPRRARRGEASRCARVRAPVVTASVRGGRGSAQGRWMEAGGVGDDEEEGEVFLDGLSYPAEVLEWCGGCDVVAGVVVANGAGGVDGANGANGTIGANGFIGAPGVPVGENGAPAAFSGVKHLVDVANANAFAMNAVDGGLVRICEDDGAAGRVEQAFVDTFRMSSPYINAHHGLVFVIHIPGCLVEEPLFSKVMEDIALMRVIGIKLVLVLGPKLQIEKRLRENGISSTFRDGVRVTDEKTLQIVKEAAGRMLFDVESVLARGVVNMPSLSRMSIVSGSFFSAQPLGVIDGEDFGYTGKIRKIEADAIQRRLDGGDIIIVPNIGFSPSGQQFNCQSESVAAACAAELHAEKLIFMANGESIYDKRSDRTIPNLTMKSAARFLRLRAHELPSNFRIAMQEAVRALEGGVRRTHILNRFTDGVLLMEVFHRDGVGLMISRDLYEGIRRARVTDVMGIRNIIRPLENAGILKARNRADIERDIRQYVVIERDGMIIACLSLQQMPDDSAWAELGCLAVHPQYRKLGKGDAMLGFTERMAYSIGVRHLFILSTQSFHWFQERGFREVAVSDLPASRQQYYDMSRKSKIFHKLLEGSRAVDEAEVLKHL